MRCACEDDHASLVHPGWMDGCNGVKFHPSERTWMKATKEATRIKMAVHTATAVQTAEGQVRASRPSFLGETCLIDKIVRNGDGERRDSRLET